MEAVKDAIRREMNDLADHVAGGGCASFEDYSKITGKIEGLAVAERIILDYLEGQHRD